MPNVMVLVETKSPSEPQSEKFLQSKTLEADGGI